ncbi:MAG TPA: AAA family ATPase [Thermoanaerobaculia bacterium]
MIDRTDADSARDVMEELLQDERQRRLVLTLMAGVIDVISGAAPKAWSTTLHSDRISVNVGTWMTFGIRRNSLWLGCVDDDLVPEAVRSALTEPERHNSFSTVVPNAFAWIPLDQYLSHAEDFDHESLRVARALAERSRKAPWKDAHSPGVLDYLASELDRAIPQASFVPPQPPQSDLDMLIGRFSSEFLATPNGQKHLDGYRTIRESATRNWRSIQQLVEEHQDATDAILTKLLPHANSIFNRERGAWTHVAPVVTREIKQWFEGAGWATPEQWPQIARAIYDFVASATARPLDLQAACEQFMRDNPAKGIQAGVLSPILHALDPQSFALYNMKSRATINALSGSSFGARLLDYPAANAAILQFIAGHDRIRREAESRGALPIDLFDCFSHWFVAISGKTEAEYWKISPGEEGRLWNDWREQRIATIGWNALGDLTGVTREEFETIRNELALQNPEYTKHGTEQVWRFARGIAEGDYLVANRGFTEVVGIGRVTGPYAFDATAKHGHRIPVDWFDTTVRRVDKQGWRKTLIPLSQQDFDAIRNMAGDIPGPSPEPAENVDAGEPAAVPGPVSRAPMYTLDDLARETGVARETAAMWVRAIQRKKQAIFYGPPGTGKTFLAERLARYLVGGGTGFMETLQFHPAYSYEDFMEGMRPQNSAGGLSYPVVPGRFRSFCERASGRDTCVLVIDEINRANLARVFGELMYLLEYRDQSVPLASGTQFSIPENVRIIGTMNTADRSIALVDHALRRRFAFLPLHPDYDVLTRYHESSPLAMKVVSLLEEINRSIDAHYRIGISFFLVKNLEQHLADIWRMEIEPYLEEYFFDDGDRCKEIRWERVAPRLELPVADAVSDATPEAPAGALAEHHE